MICRQCGKENEDNAKFCLNCGCKFEEDQPDRKKQQITPNSGSAQQSGYGANNYQYTSPVGKGSFIDFIACVFTVLFALSTVFPYATVSLFGFKESVSLLQGGDAVFVLIIAAVTLVFVFLKKEKVLVICGIVAVAFIIFETVMFSSSMADGMGALVSKGFGYYLMVISAIGMLAAPFIQKYALHKEW